MRKMEDWKPFGIGGLTVGTDATPRPYIQIGANMARLDWQDVSSLHEWLGQWLKGNPKKVEVSLIVFNNGETRTCPGSAARALESYHSHPDVAAIIPISYHIGEGLDTEEQDD